MMSKPRSPGNRIAQAYEVVELHRHGGQAWVYNTIELTSGRHKAAKQLDADPASGDYPILEGRFRAAARIRLQHPNLVTPERCVECGDDLFLIEPFVEGEELTSVAHVHGVPLPMDQIFRIGRHVARALSELHARGVVHRDLKPANVMIRPGGEAVLIDMGIAHVPGSPLTRAGAALGTEGWMSPEQAQGSTAGPQSDLFNLGSLLWWMTTAREPGPGPLHPRASNGDVPAALDNLVARLTRPEPSARPSSTGDVVRELESIARASMAMNTAGPRCLACGEPVGRTDLCEGCGNSFGSSVHMLEFSSGTLAGARFWAPLGRYIVGRHQLCPEDDHLSRRQFAVECAVGQMVLSDLRPPNPTIVHGQPLHSAFTLGPGARIGLASSTGRYTQGPGVLA